MEETEPGTVSDAGIIAVAQKVEHYEISTYGTLAAYAKVLKENVCLKNLLTTLNEEKKCDKLLTLDLIVRFCNKFYKNISSKTVKTGELIFVITYYKIKNPQSRRVRL